MVSGSKAMSLYEILQNFYIYGFLGWCAEVAFAAVKEKKFVNRGFLNGPICPIYGIGVTAVIGALAAYRGSLPVLYLLSVILVTLLEWITGFLLEKLFHHRWWDYSRMPLNIGGYVCVLFSLIWGICCVVIVRFVHPAIAAVCSFLPHWLGWSLSALFGAVLIADLYVTVSNILKFNRTLAQMEALGAELHRISDMLGENIYRNMKEGMELQELVKSKAGQTAEDMRAKAEDIRARAGQTAEEIRIKAEQRAEEMRNRYLSLKQKYQETAEGLSLVNRRLLKAFPLMKPSRYETEFADLKQQLGRLRKKTKANRKK